MKETEIPIKVIVTQENIALTEAELCDFIRRAVKVEVEKQMQELRRGIAKTYSYGGIV